MDKKASKVKDFLSLKLRQLRNWLGNLLMRYEIGLIAIITNLLAFAAITAGVIGMLATNSSLKGTYKHAILPLEELRATKFALEYVIIQNAKDLKEGKISETNGVQDLDKIYSEVHKRIENAETTMRKNWAAYSSSDDLTEAERQKLPKSKEAMERAFKSIGELKEAVKTKNLMALIDFVESDMPFSLATLSPILDDLMQIQVVRAHELYEESQLDFERVIILVVLIYLFGAALAYLAVDFVTKDILGGVHRLVGESKMLAENKLDEPFIWIRNDEIGQLGQSMEHTRTELKKLIDEIQKRSEELFEASQKVRNLLNNADQGFLSFELDMAVHNEYSKICEEIFGEEIGGRDISQLLFKDDTRQREFFANSIESIADSDDDLFVENILSLLPFELQINKKTVSIEYKLLEDNHFMLILTDITEKKMLEKKLEKEKNTLKMIVSAVENHSEFFELLDEYEQFMKDRASLVDDSKTPLHNISNMYRSIHTFKGLFAQKDFITTPQGLHKLESKLSKFMADSKTTNEELLNVLKKVTLEEWLKSDIDIIAKFLGEEFFDKRGKLTVDIKVIENLQEQLKLIGQKKGLCEDRELEHILTEMERLKRRPLFELLSSYPKLVEQLSLKLEKYVYPLQIVCDKETYVEDRHKPFIKSLVHIFRNSLDHGLECAEERLEAGKDEVGTISCVVSRNDSVVQIMIADDGKGIDTDTIAAKALKLGLFSEEQLARMNNDELIDIIFLDNFSTSSEITDLSGRGVGLAAVKTELISVGGSMRVMTERGKGTTFIFLLPNSDNSKRDNA